MNRLTCLICGVGLDQSCNCDNLPDAKPYAVGEVTPKKKPTHPWRCHVERGIDLHDKRRIPQSATMGIKV